LCLWQLVTTLRLQWWLSFSEIPTPVNVIVTLLGEAQGKTFYLDIAHSLERIACGFLLAALGGVATGIGMARSVIAFDVLNPLIELVRPIPAIAMVPLAILLFPTNEQGIVAITFAAAFFPIVVSTYHAARALPLTWEDAVRTLGASNWQVIRHVVLPGALPGIFSGFSVGMGVSWVCVISAEMISGQYGVGYRTWEAYTMVNYSGVMAGMATIGLLGWLTSTAINSIRRVMTAWLPREKSGMT